jgi:hypothetical protein
MLRDGCAAKFTQAAQACLRAPAQHEVRGLSHDRFHGIAALGFTLDLVASGQWRAVPYTGLGMREVLPMHMAAGDFWLKSTSRAAAKEHLLREPPDGGRFAIAHECRRWL